MIKETSGTSSKSSKRKAAAKSGPTSKRAGASKSCSKDGMDNHPALHDEAQIVDHMIDSLFEEKPWHCPIPSQLPTTITGYELVRMVHDACDSDATNYFAVRANSREDTLRFYVESRDHFYRMTVDFRRILMALATGRVQLIEGATLQN